MKTLIVIPARLESTRLPQKLLLRETGQTLLQHTYESACKSSKASDVLVAADSPAIVAEVERFGGQAVLTDPAHPSGTDRIAEVAQSRPEFQLIVNVQGDEPELPASAIDLAISLLEENSAAQMATLATPIRNRDQLNDPNCVKVVMNQRGEALYFSRAPIPLPRNWSDELLTESPAHFFQHIGLYAYHRDFLLTYPSMKKPAIELLESLEQLRALHAGSAIQVGIVKHPVVGIDTAADYESFVQRWRASGRKTS